MVELNLITLEAIEQELGGLLVDLEEGTRSPTSIPGIPNTVDSIANAHARTMDKITRQLEKKQISVDVFNRKAHDAISKNFEKAHRIGRGKALDAGDKLWLQGAVQTEMKFAGKFGNDIVNDRMVMPRKRRASLYGTSIKASFWNAKVEAEGKKDPNVRISWVMNSRVENCVDCQLLSSSSPFNIRNLPTVPQASATICRTGCQCRLTFRSGPATRKERKDFEQYGNRKAESLGDMLAPGQPPKGLTLPNKAEQFFIDDMRNQINYNRRLIAQGNLTDDELRAAIAARKEANAALIEFVEDNKLHEVPFWSVDDVIDGAHIGARAEADIFSAGIDSDTLAFLGEKDLGPITVRYSKEVKDGFKIKGKYSTPKIEGLTEEEKSKEELEKESFSRFRRGASEYVLMGKTLKDTFDIIPRLFRLMVDAKKLRMGPLQLGDAVLAKTSIWLKGPELEVEALLKKLKGDIIATPVFLARRKD